jgi:two-component system OmpR family sensor kinase
LSKLRFLPRSLRWRLQLWLAFLLVAMLAGFGVTVYQLQKVNRFSSIDGELEIRISALAGALRELYIERGPPEHGPPPHDFGFDGPPPDGPPPFKEPAKRRPPPGMDGPRGHGPPPRRPDNLQLSADAAALFGNRPGDYYYVVWYRDGSVLKRSGAAPAELTRPELSERDTLPHFRTRDGSREGIHCSGTGDCVMAGRSVAADLHAARNFGWTLLGAGGGVLALGLGLGFWFTTRAIRPIETISAAASRISHGNLSERVEGADSGDELGNLAGVLNSTFSRLESAFERQRQFTADAAHELRTPLAVIISETQTTLARERTAVEYRETVEACLETAQQMRRLTESLLELARFDAGEEDARTDVDVADTARLAVEKMRFLAEQRGVAIETSLQPAYAFADADRIGRVIANLLTNAIYYNKAHGTVRVSTESAPDGALIKVSDTGIGIAAADIAHIFDRFYRVDKARSRAEGHAGLGLAISKAIVEGEGGSIEVASVVGEGTRFTVRLRKSRAGLFSA